MDTSKKKIKESKAAPSERLVYCGPNMPGGLLRQFAVYKGGIPPFAEEAISRCPEIKELFVPVTELARARVDLGSSGTLLNQAYQEAQMFFTEGGK